MPNTENINKTLDSYYEEVAILCNKYHEEILLWKNNPLHWSNNKRKLHGLCTLRGIANKKGRCNFPQHIVNKYYQLIYPKIATCIELALPLEVNKYIDSLADIKEIPHGKYEFNEEDMKHDS